MTEQEAKTKWCPFVRARGGNVYGGHHTTNDGARCIGSACMAWREGGYPPIVGDTITITVPAEPRIIHGYCGLAGNP